MRTTTANFKRAFQRGTQEPIVVSRICYRHPGPSAGETVPAVNDDLVSLFHFDNSMVDDSAEGGSTIDTTTTPNFTTTKKFGTHAIEPGPAATSNHAKFAPPAITGDFTIELWVRPNNVVSNAYHHPIISGPIAGTTNWQHPGFQLRWEGTGQAWMITPYQCLAFEQYDGTDHQYTSTPYHIVGSDIDGSGNPGLEAGVWSHIAVVRQITGSDCTISLYVNGVRHKEDTGKEIRAMTFTEHSGTGNHWIVGRMTNNWSNGYFWGTSTGGGQIDEVAVSNEARYTGASFTLPTSPYESTAASSTAPDVRSWDVATDEIPGLGTPQAILGRQSDGIKPALLGMTQIGQTLDPLTRTISTGDLTLRVAGRDIASTLVPDPSEQAADQTFYRKLVEVYIAHPELTNPSDWLKIFHGYTDDVVAVGGDAVEFRCKNFEEVLNGIQWGGSLYDERPITHAWNILNYAKSAGILNQSLLTIDGYGSGESFSPDNAQIAGTKSWALTTLYSKIQSYQRDTYPGGKQALMEGFPGPNEDEPPAHATAATTGNTVSARSLIDIMLRPYMGSIWINGAGVISFQAFHTTTDRAFTQDQYQDFKQSSGYRNVINRVTMRQKRGGEEYSLTRENAASIAKFGERAHVCPNFALMRSYLEPVGGSTQQFVLSGDDGALIQAGALQGFTGIKYAPEDFGELGYLLFAPWGQIATYDKLDAPGNFRAATVPAGAFDWMTQVKTAYFLYNADGTIKWNSDEAGGVTYTGPSKLIKPRHANLNIVDTAIEDLPAWAGSGMFPQYFPVEVPEGRECSDVTQWVYFTKKILDRFAVGAPTASVVVDMSNADLEIGDIITLEGCEYTWEGFDDTDVLKWEITSIEFNPTEDNPGIRFELCAASQSGGEGFTTHVIKTDWTKPQPANVGNAVGTNSDEIGTVADRMGYGVESGLEPAYEAETATVTIQTGSIGNGTTSIPFRVPQGRASDEALVPTGELSSVEDSTIRFHRYNLDDETRYRCYAGRDPGSIILQALLSSSSDEFPIVPDQGVPICQFTTDANGDPDPGSLIDLRDVGTLIEASILPAALGGANLGFEYWKRPTNAPDSWELKGTPANWIGYYNRHTADSKSGAQCLRMNAADGADLASKWFTCKGGESRRLVYWINPTTATAKMNQTVVEIEQRDRDRGFLAGSSTAGYGVEGAGGAAPSGETEGDLCWHADSYSWANAGSSAAADDGRMSWPGLRNSPWFSDSPKFGSSAFLLKAHWTGTEYVNKFTRISPGTDLQWDGDFTFDFWLGCPVADTFFRGERTLFAADQRPDITSNLGMVLEWRGASYETNGRTFLFGIANSAGDGQASCRFNYFGGAADVSDYVMQNNYNHVAICRESGVVNGWLNGKLMTQTSITGSDSGSVLTTTGTVNSYNKPLYMGRDVFTEKVSDDEEQDDKDAKWWAFDEVRIVKGSAEFTGASFTPPAAAYGTAAGGGGGGDDTLVSLFHFDNTFEDESAEEGSTVDSGTTPTFTTTKKFGTHAIEPGPAATSNHANFAPPAITGDFTVECWVRLDSVAANAYHNPIISGPIAGTTNWQHPGFQLYWEGTGQGWMQTYNSLVFQQYDGSDQQYTVTPYSIVGSDIDGSGNPGLEAGVWSHIAVVRQITGSDCTISLYVNGVRHKEDTGKEIRAMTFTTHSGTGNHWIVGRMTNNVYNGYFWGTSTGGGQIDEVAVFNTAKYTGATYDVPTEAYSGEGEEEEDPIESTPGTWYENSAVHKLDPAAAFYRFKLKRSGVITPVTNDAVLLDDFSFDVVQSHGTKAGLSADFTIEKDSAIVPFDEAVIDPDRALTILGDNAGLWFAPTAGIYRARWHLTAKTCNISHFNTSGAVQIIARTGTSAGVLDATLSVTQLQTSGQDSNACAVDSVDTYFAGDAIFEVGTGESFGLVITEDIDEPFTLYGAAGGVTPGCWMTIEAVQLST